MEYLTQEQILAMHNVFLNPDRHELGVRNYGILYMAVEDAQKSANAFEAAAMYMEKIARFQPMNDGNRRTGFGSAVIFLRMNGIKVDFKQKEVPDFMVKVKNGIYTIEQIAGILKDESKEKKVKSFEDALEWFVDKYPKLIKNLEDLP